MNNLLAMTIAGSAAVVLMLLLRPATVKLFPASWQYRIGKPNNLKPYACGTVPDCDTASSLEFARKRFKAGVKS